MKEKEKNRAHFLLDCLENNGQITINREDMLNVLKLNREITIEEMERHLKIKGLGRTNGLVIEREIKEVVEQMKGDKELCK